jgi:hypothetical protein
MRYEMTTAKTICITIVRYTGCNVVEYQHLVVG